MADRQRLPDRRPQVVFDFTWNGIAFVGSVGFDRALRPMEIFVSCSKTTTETEAMGRDAAVLVSLLLQHGGSFQECRDAVTRLESGGAASLVGCVLDEIEAIRPETVRELLRG